MNNPRSPGKDHNHADDQRIQTPILIISITLLVSDQYKKHVNNSPAQLKK